MIKRTSNKLFWDKYAYKLGVYNSATHIFRNKRLETARTAIDGLELAQSQGHPLRIKFHRYSQRETDISENDFHDLKVLITHFQDNEDFMLRCEGSRLGVYSNNVNWLKTIGRKLKDPPWLWEPTMPNMEKNTIVVNKPVDYEFKAYLNGTADPNFADYCLNNKDNIRAGDRLIRDLKQERNLKGKYIYVKNDSILTIVRLFLNDNIMRIDKLVYQP